MLVRFSLAFIALLERRVISNHIIRSWNMEACATARSGLETYEGWSLDEMVEGSVPYQRGIWLPSWRMGWQDGLCGLHAAEQIWTNTERYLARHLLNSFSFL